MGFKQPVADKLDGSKKNVPQNKAVIRQAEKKDAETVFQMIRALAEYHGEDAEFRATLKDVQRDGFGEHSIYESWLAEIDGVPWGVGYFFSHLFHFQGQSLSTPR